MQKAFIAALVAVTALAVVALAAATPSGSRPVGKPTSYVVVYEAGVSKAAARAAIRAAGGQLIRENAKVGVATIVSRNSSFLTDAAREAALLGATRNRPVAQVAPLLKPKVDAAQVRQLRRALRGTGAARAVRLAGSHRHPEPLAPLQWDMRMINATPDGSYQRERGDKKVLVGVLDTGVDGNHPDIAPNFSRSLSRNFTVDIPIADGPCAEEPDQSCNDPADVDENSHGTHVASTIASPINGHGIAGVAPQVTIVNLRAGQDSGYFFLQSSVDALTYAGDIGVDVANMSYYIDPWRYNCANNPADSPAAQLEQRTVIAATQRALDYAHARGVTLIAAAGNEHEDLGKPVVDTTSPNFPPGPPPPNYTRNIDNSCLILPTEGNNVMSVSSIGPSERKADYSNYGVEQTTVAAPGGWFRDSPLWKATDPPAVRNIAGIPNQILAAYPENVAREFGELNPDGTPNTPFVVRDCTGGTCSYYQWIQGTSMASPHAAGVAALIVSKYGDKRRGGITLNPAQVENVLTTTARDKACPEPRLHSYADKLRPPSFDALCEGTPEFNGFYGHGIIDALAAVAEPRGQGKK